MVVNVVVMNEMMKMAVVNVVVMNEMMKMAGASLGAMKRPQYS